MNPSHLARLAPAVMLSSAVLGLLAAACAEGPPAGRGSQDACVGDACGAPSDTGDGGGGGIDVPGEDSGGDDVAPPEDSGVDAGCPGAENACGGCAELAEGIGEVCGFCEDGVWACQGPETVVCDSSLTVPVWYADLDGDGFGNPASTGTEGCEAPDEQSAPNGDDCNDTDRRINPDAEEACNGTDDDCDDDTDEAPDDQPDCTDVCCDAEAVCDPVARRCLTPCATFRCGVDLEECCADGDICYADTCATVGNACEFTEQCAVDDICEPSIGQCLPREVVPECVYVPPVGEFSPRLSCRWTSAGLPNSGRQDVVATPVVINLTDDNGDGATDRYDIPDIAFLSYNYSGDGCCNVPASLRVVSGRCNDDGTADTPATMTTLASLADPVLNNDSGIAAGDLTGDGVPELVAIGYWGRAGDDSPQGTVAFQRTADDGTAWSVLWTNEEYPTWDVHTRGGATISLADLEGNGTAEVIIGNVALNGQTGDLLWDGNDSAPEGETVGVGNNAFLGPSSTVADVDRDGFMEVVAGNTMYNWNGTIRATFEYTTSNSDCGGDLPCDGFNAVANFDADPEAEIVIVRLGEVFVLQSDMETVFWRQDIPVDDCGLNEAGPPTVADFDGDGRLEIGTAGADYYVVVDRDCDTDGPGVPVGCQGDGVLWTVPNHDCSSRATASSVFDFEGDGRAEVIYADEDNFRIFDGLTGTILFDDDTHGSHTRIEMPVIADVDDDGNAEIIIPENRASNGLPGIDVWEDGDDNWVRTRRIWNQHGYHITNVTEDGAIPSFEEANWLSERLNNYRQNVQPAGLFDAPDLLVSELTAESDLCFFDVTITVRNEGALSVPPGMPVRLEAVDDEGNLVASQDLATATRLFPGGRETLTFSLALPETSEEAPYTIRATIDPDATVNECDEEDNSASITADLTCVPKD